MTSVDQQVLATLGVDADSEHVYRLLLACPGASMQELRRISRFGAQRLRAALSHLERRAMITQRSGSPRRYHPAPPELAVEALISAREAELKQARLDARALTTTLRERPSGRLRVTEVVEVLASADAVAERWVQLQLAARTRVEAFVRPPFVRSVPEEQEPIQESLGTRSVVMHAIYDADALRCPGMLPHVRRVSGLGEESRTVSKLPLKLVLFDRSAALVPLTQLGPGSTVNAGLVIHRSTLLGALTDLFDTYWRRATPLWAEGDRPIDAKRSTVTDEQEILALLAAGLKDAAIARQLSVSTYTVRRRIAGVAERLGTTNRFQTGLALGRQGWPRMPPADPPPDHGASSEAGQGDGTEVPG